MVTERASVVRPVVDDLKRIFQTRLEAVVAYGWQRHAAVPTLALVQSLSMDDLIACADRGRSWRRAGAATPLLLTRRDFMRSLDAFPIEYGEILQQHEVVFGSDPFAGLHIDREDLRRACEVQVKSHLLHLREDYIEAGGRHGDIDALVRDSTPGVAVIMRHLARLDGAAAETRDDLVRYARDRIRVEPRVAGDVLLLADADSGAAIDTAKLFPEYLAMMERLAEFVDAWRE
jgi:hypothetical protein